MAACPAFDGSEPYVGHVLAFVDCHALALGQDGWGALGPGTAWGMALSGLMTLCVALFGYRLLLGEGLALRDGVWLAARLGLVLALSTQWAAWQAVVFNVATNGPGEVAADVLAPSGLGGQDQAGLAARIQRVGEVIDADLHPPIAEPAYGAPLAESRAARIAPPPETQPLPEDAATPLAQAGRILLVSALAGLVAARLTLALLLALGPIFVGFLLFAATSGLFASWVRVLFGAGLAAVAVPAVLAVELAVIEPQLAALAGAMNAKAGLGLLPEEIWASAVVFALVMLAVLVGVMRAAAGFTPGAGVWRANMRERVIAPPAPTWPVPAQAAPAALVGERSRAHHVADAALAMVRRDERVLSSEAHAGRALPVRNPDGHSALLPTLALVPFGQQGRRPHQRHSGMANRRDAR